MRTLDEMKARVAARQVTAAPKPVATPLPVAVVEPREVRLSFVTGQFDNNPQEFTMTYGPGGDFGLHLPVVGTKDGLAFIPAVFEKCPPEGCGSDKCPDDRRHRIAENVTHMTGLGCDLDGDVEIIEGQQKSKGMTEEQLASVLSKLEASPYAHYVWATHSDGKPGKGRRLRVFFPFNEPFKVNGGADWATVRDQLLGHVGLAEVTDAKTKDRCRIFFTARFNEATP